MRYILHATYVEPDDPYLNQEMFDAMDCVDYLHGRLTEDDVTTRKGHGTNEI